MCAAGGRGCCIPARYSGGGVSKSIAARSALNQLSNPTRVSFLRELLQVQPAAAAAAAAAGSSRQQQQGRDGRSLYVLVLVQQRQKRCDKALSVITLIDDVSYCLKQNVAVQHYHCEQQGTHNSAISRLALSLRDPVEGCSGTISARSR